MTQYLDPIIVSIKVMGQDELNRTRKKYKALAWSSRRRLWWSGLRLGVIGFLVIAFIFLICGGLFQILNQIVVPGEGPSDSSTWRLPLIFGPPIGLFIWFVTNKRLNEFTERFHSEYVTEKEELQMHKYTLSSIRSRHRELKKAS